MSLIEAVFDSKRGCSRPQRPLEIQNSSCLIIGSDCTWAAFQAASTLVALKVRVVFIRPRKLDEVPKNVHTMNKFDGDENLRLFYPRTASEFVGFFHALALDEDPEDVFIIVDAVDDFFEASPTLDAFFASIKELEGSKVKVLVTSKSADATSEAVKRTFDEVWQCRESKLSLVDDEKIREFEFVEGQNEIFFETLKQNY